MRIQHNIMAMNAYRNYNNNNKALSGNLEKLSSGYKINRAGDDAAGLAISEKMRAQITGLNAAQKNVKDGVSLVKTAEGAMQEIQDMLNRMDYLATQSANGTYDNEVDRANLQKEVENLKTEINRIADSANFNGIKLLDGSLDENVKAVTETISTTTGGQSDVPILQDVATDPTAEVGSKTVLREPTAATGKTIIQMELGDVTLTGQDGDEFTVKVGDTEIKLNVDGLGTAVNALKAGTSYTGKALADKIVSAFNAQGATIQKQGFNATASVDANGNASVKFEQKNEPTSKDEVVGTNVAVEFTHKQDPNGHATKYTLSIKDEDIAEGDTITIGGIDEVLKNAGGTAESLSAHFATPQQIGDYNVSYDSTKGELVIEDVDGTAGKPTVTFDSYSDPVKLEANQVKGEDAVKAAYTVQVKSSGVYSKGESQVYENQLTPSTFSGVKTEKFIATANVTFAAGDVLTYNGVDYDIVADSATPGANEMKESDANALGLTLEDLGFSADDLSAKGYGNAVISGNTITYTATSAGAVASGNVLAVGDIASTSFAGNTSIAGLSFTKDNTNSVTGKAADTIVIGGVTLTVGDATDLDNNVISAADANNGTKLAATLAPKINQALIDAAGSNTPDWTVTASGDKLVYTANVTGTTGRADAPQAAPSALTNTGTGGTLTIGGFNQAANGAGKDPDTLTIGNVTLKIDEDISAADASNSSKLAEALAKKMSGDPDYALYDITADGDKLVFTAKNGGQVGGTTSGVPTKAPAALPKTDAASTSGGSGKVEFGNVTEAAVGKDATKSYTEYDLSGLKEGDIVTVGTGNAAREFVVGANGLKLTDTSRTTGHTTDKFSDALVAAAGLGSDAQITLDNGKLKIEAATEGSNAVGPKATIKVETKGTTDATNKLDTPASKGSITGTWNVQSTINKEGGTLNPNPLASTAFTMDKNMVKDGNTLTIGKDTYVFKVGAESTVTAKDGQKLIDLSKYEADSADLVKQAAMALSNIKDNSAFTIGYDEKATGGTDTAKITIHEKLGQTDYTTELESVEEFDKLVYMTAPEVTTEETKTTGKDGKPLTLQIGDTSESFNQMKVSIGDMHTKAMGKGEYVDENGETVKIEKTIADIDIGNQEGAAEAVNIIKNAINYVSSVRGDLGAIQNRLDHTANNLSVMAENIQDAESTIRDTDVAEEMMSYVKNNILVQSAQAMLAQANQVPQGVLQLLG